MPLLGLTGQPRLHRHVERVYASCHKSDWGRDPGVQYTVIIILQAESSGAYARGDGDISTSCSGAPSDFLRVSMIGSFWDRSAAPVGRLTVG